MTAIESRHTLDNSPTMGFGASAVETKKKEGLCSLPPYLVPSRVVPKKIRRSMRVMFFRPGCLSAADRQPAWAHACSAAKCEQQKSC